MENRKIKSRSSVQESTYSGDKLADADDFNDTDSFKSRSLASYDPEPAGLPKGQSRQDTTTNGDTKSVDSYDYGLNSRPGKSSSIEGSKGHERSRREPDAKDQGNEQTIAARTRSGGRDTAPGTGRAPTNVPLKLPSLNKLGGGWQEGKSVVECNLHMLTREIGCDVTFLVGDAVQPMKAHKYVLVSRSSALHRLLSERLHEIDTLISVPDVQPDVFKAVLKYLYTGEIDWNVHIATELLHPASKFGFITLKRECFEHLVSQINSDNVCTVLEHAHKYSVLEIYENCLRFAHINGVEVLNSPAFRNLCKECVEAITRSDNLNADEMLVYSALILWADDECRRRKIPPNDHNRRTVLGRTLYSVRFSLIDVGVFASTISQNDVLSPDEKIILFQHYHGEISKLPANFNRSPRRQYTVADSVNNHVHGFSTPDTRPYIPRLQLTEPISNRSYDDVMSIANQPAIDNNRNRTILRVLRFRGIGETWQLNGPDAISFRSSEELHLRGVQIFGPSRHTDYYNVTLSVFDEYKNEVRKENINVITDRSKVFDVVLTQPVAVHVGRLYTVRTLMKGRPTIRGTDGVTSISTEGVEFEFKNSNLSSNGTDVTSGQIPSILFSKLGDAP